jgi:hypothetical protein
MEQENAYQLVNNRGHTLNGSLKVPVAQNDTFDIAELSQSLHCMILNATRLTTGLCHYVYLLNTERGPFVLRVADTSSREYLRGSAYWIPRLQKLSLPVPTIMVDGSEESPAFQVLSYFPGDDLGAIYLELSKIQKSNLASTMLEIQSTVSTLPIGKSYGYKFSYENDGYTDWESVIVSGLNRSLERFQKNKVFDLKYVNHLISQLPKYHSYFNEIEPKPYLDDATTKNVIIMNGKLAGLVDLDEICFGDWLRNPAMTQMSLLAMGFDTIYTEEMIALADLCSEQLAAFAFYQACSCVDFMSEIGMVFNKEEPIELTEEKQIQMKMLFDKICSSI